MRDPNRIDEFCNELAKLWKEECPDWRFFQLICNLQRFGGSDLFYIEDERAIEIINQFLKG